MFFTLKWNLAMLGLHFLLTQQNVLALICLFFTIHSVEILVISNLNHPQLRKYLLVFIQLKQPPLVSMKGVGCINIHQTLLLYSNLLGCFQIRPYCNRRLVVFPRPPKEFKKCKRSIFAHDLRSRPVTPNLPIKGHYGLHGFVALHKPVWPERAKELRENEKERMRVCVCTQWEGGRCCWANSG